MNGIHVINDPNGQPAVVTIDLHNLDPDVSPLVNALLGRIGISPITAPDYEYAASFEEERREFLYASGVLANRAYGDDEPEYDETDLIEKIPNYRPL